MNKEARDIAFVLVDWGTSSLRIWCVDHSSRVITEHRSPLGCLLYTSPSPRDKRQSRMPSSA